MLGREAKATLPTHMLMPPHVVRAFVTLQEEAAPHPSQCRTSLGN